MKYELGDYVQINKRWKKTKEYLNEESLKIEDAKTVVIRKKIDCKETGFIAGFRYGYTQSKEVMKILDEGAEFIQAYNHQVIDVYLVATRMNCLYEVSKEDMQLIKDVEELR
ncbi:hypothetical protein [Mammaliicoccus sciuri]|uniref:hypothetical protein n=1 Tax=Mammaliicoccus sciuri TaxID=1296 RepID=UPI0034DD836B